MVPPPQRGGGGERSEPEGAETRDQTRLDKALVAPAVAVVRGRAAGIELTAIQVVCHVVSRRTPMPRPIPAVPARPIVMAVAVRCAVAPAIGMTARAAAAGDVNYIARLGKRARHRRSGVRRKRRGHKSGGTDQNCNAHVIFPREGTIPMRTTIDVPAKFPPACCFDTGIRGSGESLSVDHP